MEYKSQHNILHKYIFYLNNQDCYSGNTSDSRAEGCEFVATQHRLNDSRYILEKLQQIKKSGQAAYLQ